MDTIRVVCPHCSFSREVPADKLPDKPVQVTCPQCRKTFPFSRSKDDAAPPLPSQVHAAPAAKPEPPPPPPKPEPSLQRPATKIIPPAPEQVVTEKQPAPLVLVALALLLVVAAGWWLNFPQPSAVPDGSHTDGKNFFAVKAPPDWLLVTPANYETIMKQYRDRIPNELAGVIGKGKPGFTVSFFRIPATETEFAPNLNVVMVDTKGKNLPRLTEKEKNSAAGMAAKEISRQFAAYRMLEAKIVEVDGLDSLQITGEADLSIVTKPSQPIYSAPGAFNYRSILGRTEEEKQAYKLRILQTMIPGSKRAYVLSFIFDDLKAPDMATVHRQVLDTFRVLERPPRFGNIMNGALNGGLIGAGLYLLGIVVTRLASRGKG